MKTPDTDCPHCWSEEAGLLARIVDKITNRSARAIQQAGHAWAAQLRAHTGRAPVTWYDRHRERYEQTGNPIELERMERHVSPEEADLIERRARERFT